jgi:hypothetical protein
VRVIRLSSLYLEGREDQGVLYSNSTVYVFIAREALEQISDSGLRRKQRDEKQESVKILVRALLFDLSVV